MELSYPELRQDRDFLKRSDKGHLDLPRAREGGFAGGLFAVFAHNDGWMHGTPDSAGTMNADGYSVEWPPQLTQKNAETATRLLLDTLFRIEAESGGEVKVCRDYDELADCLQRDILAAVIHFEGAETILPDLSNLGDYYETGLRSLGLVWSRPNDFACGVPFRFPDNPDIGPGLTSSGRALVRACDELGILIDLAHINAKGFWDVVKLAQGPLVASHAGAHALNPSTRNLTDDQLDAIAASGGLVGVNFHRVDLRWSGALDAEVSLSEIVRHIRYIADRVGVDHVAFGSDFDGAYMPQDLADVASLPKLVTALRESGFDRDALAKICCNNWLRVLKAAWRL